MIEIRSALLGAALFGAGLLAAGALPDLLVPEANAEEGGAWQCYVVDRFPKMDKAAEWTGAVNYTDALNRLAPHAEKGELLVATYPVGGMGAGQGGAPLLCVKG